MSLQQELDALTAKITASKRIPQQIAPQFMAGIKEQIATARYLIAREGIVAYAEVNPDYTDRAEPSDLLPILDKLARSKSATGRFSPTQP